VEHQSKSNVGVPQATLLKSIDSIFGPWINQKQEKTWHLSIFYHFFSEPFSPFTLQPPQNLGRRR
jgi:hypothetical protein